MTQKYNLRDVLEFYEQNELNEVFSSEPNDKLKIDGKSLIVLNKKTKEKPRETILEPEVRKEKLPDQSKIQESTIISNVKNISSTSQALAELAKKNQINFMENKLPNIDEKFLPLNQIVENARLLASKAKNIAELKEIVENFEGCNLKKMATNTVFADGNPNSKIMVIGEAPGNHEDLSGVPFCG